MWLRHRPPACRACRLSGRWPSHHCGRRNVGGAPHSTAPRRVGRAQPGPRGLHRSCPRRRFHRSYDDSRRRRACLWRHGVMHDVATELLDGPFTREHALALGVPARVLEGVQFRRLHQGVYVHRSCEMTWADHVEAARLALPPTARTTGATRLRQAGFDAGDRWPLHFVVQGDLHLVLDGVFLHRTVKMPPNDDDAVSIEAAFVAFCAEARLLDAITVGSVLLNQWSSSSRTSCSRNCRCRRSTGGSRSSRASSSRRTSGSRTTVSWSSTRAFSIRMIAASTTQTSTAMRSTAATTCPTNRSPRSGCGRRRPPSAWSTPRSWRRATPGRRRSSGRSGRHSSSSSPTSYAGPAQREPHERWVTHIRVARNVG